MNQMDRHELIRILASMSDAEFAEVIAEARGAGPVDVKELIEREIARFPTRWPIGLPMA